MTKFRIFLFILFALPTLLAAQDVRYQKGVNQDPANDRSGLHWFTVSEAHVHELSIYGGYAFDSFRLWGKTADATLGQMGLGYNRKLFRLGQQLLEYRFELNLYSKITYPEFEPERERMTLSGYGIVPLGLRVNFRQSKPVQPFVGTSGGFVYLNDPFPDERGKNFNYTFTAGAGLEILLNSYSSLSLGYKYYHISNGESGEINPGVDSSFFFGSLTIF